MKKEKFNLSRSCRDIIKAQKDLDNAVFNLEGLMPRPIRQKFFKLAKIYLENCVNIPEAKICDIILSGRKAGFYYQEDSAYEIWVIVNLDDVPCLSADIKMQNKYLSIMQNYKSSNYEFAINKCPVYLFCAAEQPFFCSAFSILQNKWLTEPKIDSKLTAEKLMHDYYQINCGFYEFMKQTVIFCSKDDTVQIRKFLQYAENLKNLKSTTDGLLLYCLLDYSGSLERIEAEISQMYIDMFSL